MALPQSPTVYLDLDAQSQEECYRFIWSASNQAGEGCHDHPANLNH